MADHVGELDDGDTRFELLNHKGVAEIIHFGTFNPGNAEVTIDGGANITDQERVASFSDKEGSILGLGAFAHVFFDGSFGGRIQGDFSGFVTLEGANLEIGFFEGDVLELDSGELANAKTSLEEEFDDAIHPNIVFDGVAQSPILEGGKDTGRSNVILGVANTRGRTNSDRVFADQELEKGFDGV